MEGIHSLSRHLENKWREGLASLIQRKIITVARPHDLRSGEEVVLVGTYPDLIHSDYLKSTPSYLYHKLGGPYTSGLSAEAKVEFKISGGDKPLSNDRYAGVKRFFKGVIGEIYEPPRGDHLINRPYYQMTIIYSSEPPAGCTPITLRHFGLKFCMQEPEAKIVQYCSMADGSKMRGNYTVASEATLMDFESFHSLIPFIYPLGSPSLNLPQL